MENSKFILDSNVFVAFYYENDVLHEKALVLMNEIRDQKIIVPYCVIVEVATVLTYKFGKSAAMNFLNDVTKAKNCLIVNDDLHEEIEFFAQIESKISFTDSSLIYLAEKFGCLLLSFDGQLLGLYNRRNDCL